MADFASITDIEAVWRPLTTAEKVTAAKYLRYASALIRNAVPSVDGRIAAGTLDPTVAEMVTVEMVRRVMENPDGVRQESETLGSYNHSVTYDQLVTSGALKLTDDDLAALRQRTGNAYTIAPFQERATEADLDMIAFYRAAR